ncbi:MAG: hypothetical protein O7B99_00185 [Planctomycetota bacterium]|nr:hypothetical protein [Planctomycetota bacterium]
MLDRLTPLRLVPIGLLLVSSIVRAQEDRSVGDGDLERLGKGLAAYLEARATASGLDEAQVELQNSLEELEQILEGEAPLRAHADLGRALWLSRAYDGMEVRRGKVTGDVFTQGSFEDGLKYAYRVPRDYDPNGRGLPLILAIPDADERPAEHLRSHWTSRDILDGAILVSPQMPADRAEWDRVMVDGRPGGLCHVLTALRLAGERFAVDFDRVFVAGRGKGVPAAIAAGNYGPQLFAGVIGRGGDAGDQGPENFGNLPTYLMGGGAKATAFQETARRAGFDNCFLDPTGSEKDVWQWMLAHPRTPYPSRVSLVVGQPFPTRAYWLRVAPTAPDARATASIDRSTNTVRVDTQDVSHVTLYLNDALVDLDRPVVVVCNGVEHEVAIRRLLSSTLEMLCDGTSDPGCVYVAEAVIDTAAEATASSGGDDSAGEDLEFERRLTEAEGEVDELWELYQWCQSNRREGEIERVLRRILRLDTDHAPAREARGYRGTAGLWFRSQQAFERYLLSQEPESARAKGHVEHKSLWIHRDERSFANKGWVKDPPAGQWLSGADRKRRAAGWVRQDLALLPAEDAARVDDGLWLVDGEWVDLKEANRRHSRIHAMWHVPGPEVLLHSTADRDVSLRAIEEMGSAIQDLRRVFGIEPVLPLEVAMLRDEEQYDRFAFGDPDGRRLPTDPSRMHIVSSAFFAERWFERVEGKLEFKGMGVCYWDTLAPHGDLYGVHAARLAIGLSYADAVDPSPKTVRKALARGPKKRYREAYLAEKLLPAWLRSGGAVYAGRYFHDDRAGPDGDPWWTRKWSLDNLRNRGGLRSLGEVLAFRLDPADREDCQKLLLEAGLVVAFIVDGACAPVAEAHEKLKRGLVHGSVHRSDVESLEEAVAAHEAELRVFAGL